MPNDAILPGIGGFSGTSAGDAYQLANGMIGQAEGFAAQLTAQAAALVAPAVNPNFPTVSTPPVPATATQPTLQQVAWTVPSQPNSFTGSVSNLLGFLPGPFTGTAPTLNFPSAPAAFGATEPTAPAVDLNFTYPTVSVKLPDVPNLLSLDVVTFDPITVPTFNVAVPQLNIAAPSIIRYTEGPLFTSPLLTLIESDLQNVLATGMGTYLPTQAQTAIWDAAREREYRQQADALAELDRMETLGYAFPPGIFIDARIKLQTETNNTIAGLSRDIMAKQAELQLENLVKAREQTVILESKLLDMWNYVAQRAFETAKYVTQAGIEIYNAQVQKYAASLEGFKTMAIVYDTQIKGILAQVDILKAHIEYERTKAEINSALVQQYSEEVKAALAILEIFKTQVEIIQTQAQVEKIKVDIFGAEIQAFVGQVQAYTAQVEAYKASAETQGVIESAFKTQVEAYTAQVQAGVAQITANVDVFKAQIAGYEAQLAGYDSAIKGMVGQAQAAASFNEAQAAVYRGAVEAITSYNGTLTAQWQAVLNEQEKIAEVGVAAAKANGDLYIATRGLSIDASKVGAQVSAQLGASALGAVHWSTSLSASVSAANNSIEETIQSASV